MFVIQCYLKHLTSSSPFPALSGARFGAIVDEPSSHSGTIDLYPCPQERPSGFAVHEIEIEQSLMSNLRL